MFCLGVLTYDVVLPAVEHGYKYACFVFASNVHSGFVFLDFYICVVQLN